MRTKYNGTKTAAVAPEVPRDEYEYFDMVAETAPPLPDLDLEEISLRCCCDKHPATEPKLAPEAEEEYFRRMREFRDRRKTAGRKIDPKTAEILTVWAVDRDPYGIDPLLPREWRQRLSKNSF